MKNYRIGCNTLYPDISERKGKDWRFSPEKIISALDKILDIGYTDVEYSHVFHLTVAEAIKIGEHARKIGINNWSCHAAGPDAIASNRHCIDIASAIGAKVNVLHVWDYKHDEACRILENICHYASDKNIEIALENDNTVENMDFILGLVNDVGMRNIGICVDTGHANLGDLGSARAIRMAGSLLFTTHLQDNFGKQDDHMPPGMGFIDWEDVFRALKEINYNRTFMLELTDAPPASRAYDQEKEIMLGLKNVRKYLETEKP